MFEEFKDSFPDLWERQQRAKRLREQQLKQDKLMYELFLELEELTKERGMKQAQERAEWVLDLFERYEESEQKIHELEEEVEHFKEIVDDLRSGRY